MALRRVDMASMLRHADLLLATLYDVVTGKLHRQLLEFPGRDAGCVKFIHLFKSDALLKMLVAIL